MKEKIAAIQEAIEKYSMTASVVGNVIQVRNKKNQLAAIVSENGVERKYFGAKVLCGALVRDAIKKVIQ